MFIRKGKGSITGVVDKDPETGLPVESPVVSSDNDKKKDGDIDAGNG
jgi:hypothetical protein